MSVRYVSYGGGTQSTALMVLAAEGRIDFRTFLFANVGEDSERPETLEYVQAISKPFASSNGLDLIEVRKTLRNGDPETVLGRLTKPGSRSIGIPVRMSNGAPGRRQCTADFKIRVCAKWAKKHGASEEDKATCALGFSTDEAYRCKGYDEKYPTQVPVYPLIDLRLSRQDCAKTIVGAGLPLPPKSACWFCPFHSLAEWTRMARQEPERFEAAAKLEELAQARRTEIGKDRVYFTRKGAEQRMNLPQLIAPYLDQTMLFEDEDDADAYCDSGGCFT